jgi:hypothetical protein
VLPHQFKAEKHEKHTPTSMEVHYCTNNLGISTIAGILKKNMERMKELIWKAIFG